MLRAGGSVDQEDIEVWVERYLRAYPTTTFIDRYGDGGSPIRFIAAVELALAVLVPFVRPELMTAVLDTIADPSNPEESQRNIMGLLLQQSQNLRESTSVLVADSLTDARAQDMASDALACIEMVVKVSDPAFVDEVHDGLINAALNFNDAAPAVVAILRSVS